MGVTPLILFCLAAISQQPVITESMANPQVETTGEYVEIHNPSASPCPVSGFSITDGDALDWLSPWNEAIHGALPHPGAVTECDTIPPFGFALVLELDYPSGPLLNIADGTVILTTGDHSICNGLAASSDPLTLFDGEGTASSNVISTYGTPVDSDYWSDRDDDGLDGIPFDPGEGCAVQRLHIATPDIQGNWAATAPGGTPGWQPSFPDTSDLSLAALWSQPPSPLPGVPCVLSAAVTNCGSVTLSGAETTIFLDASADSFPDPDEVIARGVFDSLPPGSSDTLSVPVTLDDGNYLLAASVSHPDDQVPENDLMLMGLVCGSGTFPSVSEVLCSPLNQDTDEYIELYFQGPGVFDLTECSFTDGDALDQIVPWNTTDPLSNPCAAYGSFMPAGSFALVLDSEYTAGTQPYDLAMNTLILTTANTTLGDGLTSRDPVTLYGPGGTGTEDVISTYGTPISSGDPLQCDDDGLDGIPYDPGRDNSVHRLALAGPDIESNWFDSDSGPTPGGPPPEIQTGTDAQAADLSLAPPMGPGQTGVSVLSKVHNCGTEPILQGSLEVILWADLDGDSMPSASELIRSCILAQELLPGDSAEVSALWVSQAEAVAVFALVQCGADSFPGNDTLSVVWNIPPGVVINEILYHPAPGEPEWIEILNGTAAPLDLGEWEFRDSGSGTLLFDSPLPLAPGSFAVACPDTVSFMAVWGDPGCVLCQPSAWPALNNSTQPGQAYADQLYLVSGEQVADYVPYDDDWGGGENVSLERLGEELPGYSPSSWTGCSSGGTPGTGNSVSQGEAPGAFLSYHPDPFSPDGDGIDDVLAITVNPGCPQAQVTVTVYDVLGRPVCELLDGEPSGSALAVAWNGTTGDGRSLPVGRYIVYARSLSSTGETREDCAVVILARRL